MDKATRNKVLNKIPYGLYILGSKTEGGVSAIIANWVCQVSFEPPMLSIAVEHNSTMRLCIERSKLFSVNMLSSGSKQVAKAFLKRSQQDGATLNGKEITISKHGTPFLKDAVASLECKVVNSINAGDHVLFLGEVVDIAHGDGDILTLKETGWKYSR